MDGLAKTYWTRQSLADFVNDLELAYKHELIGGTAKTISMNRVLQGVSVAAMKTVAKIYGSVLAAVSLLPRSPIVSVLYVASTLGG